MPARTLRESIREMKSPRTCPSCDSVYAPAIMNSVPYRMYSVSKAQPVGALKA